MSIFIIIGPSAVGKMSVANELSKAMGMTVFHNHMTLDFTSQIFDWQSEEFKYTVASVRSIIFEQFAKSSLKGIIYTFVYCFDNPSHHLYLKQLSDLFKRHNRDVFIIELEASVEVRKIRNISKERLENKITKRNIVESNEIFESFEKYKTNSVNDSDQHRLQQLANFVKINTEKLTPNECVSAIKEFIAFTDSNAEK